MKINLESNIMINEIINWGRNIYLIMNFYLLKLKEYINMRELSIDEIRKKLLEIKF